MKKLLTLILLCLSATFAAQAMNDAPDQAGCSQDSGEISQSQECPICLEPIILFDQTVILSCRHTFHQSCMDQWVTTAPNETCPMCRGQIDKNFRERQYLSNAIKSNNPEGARIILTENRELINMFDYCHKTPLHEAVIANNLEAATMLIQEFNADVHMLENAPSSAYCRSALHIAVDNGNLPMTQLLVNAGTPIDILDNKGNTPLHHVVGGAILGGHQYQAQAHNLSRFLIDNGADVTAQNAHRLTPSGIAVAVINNSNETPENRQFAQNIIDVITQASNAR